MGKQQSVDTILARAIPGYIPVTVATNLWGKALGKTYPKPESGPFYQWKRRGDPTVVFAQFFKRWFVSWDSFMAKLKEECVKENRVCPPREAIEKWLDV